MVLVDIGGDAIAGGDEPGLASPLCDAVMIAGGAAAAAAVPARQCSARAATASCGPPRSLERVAALARAGAWIATTGVTPETADEIEAAAEVAVTEASLLVARCARGTIGEVEIRGGRRIVEAGPLGALVLPLRPRGRACGAATRARGRRRPPSIEAAHEALERIGVGTELGYELRRTAGA